MMFNILSLKERNFLLLFLKEDLKYLIKTIGISLTFQLFTNGFSTKLKEIFFYLLFIFLFNIDTLLNNDSKYLIFINYLCF